jgi:carboxymethylenebutenolidase
MCNEFDSVPPIPVIAGAAVTHENLVLESADGNRFAAFLALGEEPAATSVVILPDIRGLYGFYEELALRFAERGYAAVAIDYFGRSAGLAKRDEEFAFMEHVEQTTVGQIQADIAAAIAYLRGPAGGGSVASVFTAGCCFGGSNSWLAAASGHGLAGAIGFHGGLGERGGEPGPIQRASEMEAPILALQGGADPWVPNELNAEFDAALSAAGVEHEIVLEPGAPHSFFSSRADEFAEQSADAWRRALEFIEKHSSIAA